MNDARRANCPIAMPGPAHVERAIKLSYAQMMLGAVFAASTGGMFAPFTSTGRFPQPPEDQKKADGERRL